MAYRLMIILCVINLLYLVHQNNAQLSCYVCATASNQPHSNKTFKSCNHFTQTEEFETSCPKSTYCVKRTSEFTLQDGQLIQVRERGCASQKETYHKYENGRWVEESSIDKEIYQDGCFPAKQNDYSSAVKIEYCHCSSNLCNSGKRTNEISFFHHTDTMSVIFIFNVVKFMRNIR